MVVPCSASVRPRRSSRSTAALNSCAFGGNRRNSCTPARIAWTITDGSAWGAVPMIIVAPHHLQRYDDEIEDLVTRRAQERCQIRGSNRPPEAEPLQHGGGFGFRS